VDTLGNVSVTWTRLVVSATGPEDAYIKSVIDAYATDPDYVNLVNTPIGYSAVDLPRLNGTVDNMMATFIDDAIYNQLNTDGEPTNDVDIFFNNAGGIRTDWCWNGTAWINTGCATAPATHTPGLLTYGNMFTILPFGNATITGQMTGAQILQVVQYGPLVSNGVIQPAGLKYKYYKYTDTLPPGSPSSPYTYAWGAYDVTVYNKTTHAWEPLDLEKTYNVGTNEFLAPGGGDGYNAFKYMTNVISWGDMLNAVNAYVNAHYGTPETAYMGPNGDGSLDGRIARDGDGDNTYDGGNEVVPLTVLHHNDSHGNLYKGSYVGYTQLATLINQERAHNSTRTILISSGDNIQGDALTYYYRTSPTGFASDGTPLPMNLWLNPMMAVMNAMNYDAMVLGNHEFNFGNAVFTSVLGQATFPLLQANVSDDGAYGLASVPNFKAEGYVQKTVGGDIDVSILGIGNHRVPNYEMPNNIAGLTFTNPIAKTQELLANPLITASDVIIALTHIGFTENPASVEVDTNVDTNLVMQTSGIDVLVGGHSHTNPASGFGNYKFLPTIVPDADGNPVVIGHAYRYNNTLGELTVGLLPLGNGQYQVVSQTGRYLTVSMSTLEDPVIKAIVDPYLVPFNTYNNTTIGQTTQPIDTTNAYIAETNAANLQADASVYELASHGITDVDFHLSGAMTRPSSSSNWILFPTATPATPATMKISDMFTLMPYENSLVVLSMNGPQLKAVLERAYRNYFYYKYVTGYGGYSYYTTCMLDTNTGNQITYNDEFPTYPTGNNVISLVIGGVPVDFNDASTYYNVSTVNYLAAGSCNFNDGGVSLWPLNQIVHDTQYYVRDAVINYAADMGVIGPVLEGRLRFVADTTGPVLNLPANITVPQVTAGGAVVTFTVTATDDYDPNPVVACVPPSGSTFPAGTTTVNCTATDNMSNTTNGSFTVTVTQTANLLLNPGFDQFNLIPRAWTYSVLQPPLASLTDCTVFVSPNCSLKLIGSRMTRIVTQAVAKKGLAGDSYSFGVYNRAQNLPNLGNYYVQVIFYNSLNRQIATQIVHMNPGTHDFEMVNGTLAVPTAYSKIVFRIYFQKGAGMAWFDNAYLMRLP
jgi:2',3'-cyclic-nucleotide 2'-phosphodiesterase/3'-nucleotidase